MSSQAQILKELATDGWYPPTQERLVTVVAKLNKAAPSGVVLTKFDVGSGLIFFIDQAETAWLGQIDQGTNWRLLSWLAVLGMDELPNVYHVIRHDVTKMWWDYNMAARYSMSSDQQAEDFIISLVYGNFLSISPDDLVKIISPIAAEYDINVVLTWLDKLIAGRQVKELPSDMPAYTAEYRSRLPQIRQQIESIRTVFNNNQIVDYFIDPFVLTPFQGCLHVDLMELYTNGLEDVFGRTELGIISFGQELDAKYYHLGMIALSQIITNDPVRRYVRFRWTDGRDPNWIEIDDMNETKLVLQRPNEIQRKAYSNRDDYLDALGYESVHEDNDYLFDNTITLVHKITVMYGFPNKASLDYFLEGAAQIARWLNHSLISVVDDVYSENQDIILNQTSPNTMSRINPNA